MRIIYMYISRVYKLCRTERLTGQGWRADGRVRQNQRPGKRELYLLRVRRVSVSLSSLSLTMSSLSFALLLLLLLLFVVYRSCWRCCIRMLLSCRGSDTRHPSTDPVRLCVLQNLCKALYLSLSVSLFTQLKKRAQALGQRPGWRDLVTHLTPALEGNLHLPQVSGEYIETIHLHVVYVVYSIVYSAM